MNEIQSDEPYLMLGDFNACVGSRHSSSEDDPWEQVRGPHGVGEVNEAGEELLNFSFAK